LEEDPFGNGVGQMLALAKKEGRRYLLGRW
jgi:hypothetical protein